MSEKAVDNMRQISCCILLAIITQATAPIQLSAGLYPDENASDKSKPGLISVEPEAGDIDRMERSMREFSIIQDRVNSAKKLSDAHRLINDNRENLGDLSYPSMELMRLREDAEGRASESNSSLPEPEFLDLWLAQMQASIERECIVDRLKEIEAHEATANREIDASSDSILSRPPSYLIPEPTTLTFLTLAGFSFAASRYRQRHKRFSSRNMMR